MIDHNCQKTDELYEALDDFLRSKEKTSGSGNYRRNAERVTTGWIEWLAARDPPIETFDELSVLAMRQWARTLAARVHDDEITASSAETYYGYVRAYLSWCVDEELLGQNPAEKRRATAELPKDTSSSSDQQFWQPDDRRQLMEHVTDRATSAIDERGMDAVAETRDRAIVAILTYSLARAGELFQARYDDRRQGLQWTDIDLNNATIRVLGKSQRIERAPLFEQAHHPLSHYRKVLDPPTDDWPVFPTRDAPTLCLVARTQLADDHDLTTTEIESVLEDTTCEDVVREWELTPPSITTEGVRSILRRICAAAKIDVEGDPLYLQPHGARRGGGDALYRKKSPAEAQRALRHQDPQTTSKAYSHIEAGEVATDNSDVFEDADE